MINLKNFGATLFSIVMQEASDALSKLQTVTLFRPIRSLHKKLATQISEASELQRLGVMKGQLFMHAKLLVIKSGLVPASYIAVLVNFLLVVQPMLFPKKFVHPNYV